MPKISDFSKIKYITDAHLKEYEYIEKTYLGEDVNYWDNYFKYNWTIVDDVIIEGSNTYIQCSTVGDTLSQISFLLQLGDSTAAEGIFKCDRIYIVTGRIKKVSIIDKFPRTSTILHTNEISIDGDTTNSSEKIITFNDTSKRTFIFHVLVEEMRIKHMSGSIIVDSWFES